MNLVFIFYKYEKEKYVFSYKKFNPIFERIPAGHVTSAEAFRTTPCLHDVATAFCRNVPQAKRVFSRAQRCKRCYMLKARLQKVLYKRSTDAQLAQIV
jgi:hypothetical protein